jgi:nitric oxide reductase activation protein
MKKPAHRGATAGLSNAFRQVSVERYAPDHAPLQARILSHRFGLPPATAAMLAELAFPALDSWRATR